jgi:hypothetical protein
MNDYKKIEEGDDAWKVIVGIIWDKLKEVEEHHNNRGFLDVLVAPHEDSSLTFEDIYGTVRAIVKEINNA